MTHAPLAQLSLLLLSIAISPGQAAPSPSPRAITIHPDGSLSLPAHPLGPNLASPATSTPMRCSFGLPAQPPERRGLAEGGLPVFESAWVSNGIRYTQKVLVTSLGPNDPSFAGPLPPDAVLLVQISGHNTNAEYTSARVDLSFAVDGRPLELEYREGLIHTLATPKPGLLAALDIPSEGIVTTRGLQLKFQGSMPPGTTGSMTLKIPAALPHDPKTLTRLQDLDLDEELRRLKKAWKTAPPVPAEQWPLAWAQARKDQSNSLPPVP